MHIGDLEFLQSLGFIIVFGAVFAFAGRFLKIPFIVSFIFAGLFLGPVTHWVSLNDTLELISKLGIALLLFLVGLELSFERIRDVGKVAVVAGIGQVVFTAAGGLVICLVLGFAIMEALFLALALTFSSTVVVVKLLDQMGDLNRLYGRIAVGIFLVQDLVVIVLLTVLSGLAGLEAGDTIDLVAVSRNLGLAFAGMTLILITALVSSKYVLPKPFAWIARYPDASLIWALCWCFALVLLAQTMSLSVEIGAFIAGMALAQLPYNEDLRHRLHPLMNFLIAIFFVTLGIRTDLGEALGAWPTAVVLSLFVLIGNPLIFLFIITRMRYSRHTAFRTSVTVAQISEFSFIFAAMGVTSGLIGTGVLSIVALVGIVTIAVSAYMILYSEPLYQFCQRWGLLRIFPESAPRGEEEQKTEEEERSGHIIVVGMNGLGRQLVEHLLQKGERVLAVDTDPAKLRGLSGAETFIGSVEFESVIQEIGLARARLVVSALQIEDTNHLLAYRCRMAKVSCAIHAFDLTVVDELLDLKTDYLLMPTADGFVQQVEVLRKEGFLRS